MAFMYLALPDTDPGLRVVARSILLSQGIDIGRMIQMLRDMDAPEAAETDEAMAWMGMPTTHDQMPGMATEEQLDELGAVAWRRGRPAVRRADERPPPGRDPHGRVRRHRGRRRRGAGDGRVDGRRARPRRSSSSKAWSSRRVAAVGPGCSYTRFDGDPPSVPGGGRGVAPRGGLLGRPGGRHRRRTREPDRPRPGRRPLSRPSATAPSTDSDGAARLRRTAVRSPPGTSMHRRGRRQAGAGLRRLPRRRLERHPALVVRAVPGDLRRSAGPAARRGVRRLSRAHRPDPRVRPERRDDVRGDHRVRRVLLPRRRLHRLRRRRGRGPLLTRRRVRTDDPRRGDGPRVRPRDPGPRRRARPQRGHDRHRAAGGLLRRGVGRSRHEVANPTPSSSPTTTCASDSSR